MTLGDLRRGPCRTLLAWGAWGRGWSEGWAEQRNQGQPLGHVWAAEGRPPGGAQERPRRGPSGSTPETRADKAVL